MGEREEKESQRSARSEESSKPVRRRVRICMCNDMPRRVSDMEKKASSSSCSSISAKSTENGACLVITECKSYVHHTLKEEQRGVGGHLVGECGVEGAR